MIENWHWMMADPPRFEHGFPAPEARVISRLHYGSNLFEVRPRLKRIAAWL